jgi:hypothetical protein
MSSFPRIRSVESFIISIPRDTPYLGPLGPGESVNARGYLIRQGNRAIYPSTDMSVLIKITAEDGTVGWGETYGIVAPDAVTSIIDDVLGPVILGRDPRDAMVIQEDLYDLMRVRGFFGGFYVDSIAGVDIAVWDLFGKLLGQPVVKLLGGQRMARSRPMCPGLPRATLEQRVALAREFQARGFDAFKYAAAVSQEGIVREMRVLREALGPDVQADGRPALEVHRPGGDPADRPARAVPALFRRGTLPAGGHRRAGPGGRGDQGAAGAGRGMAHRLRGAAPAGAAQHVDHAARDGAHRHQPVHADRAHGERLPCEGDSRMPASASASSRRPACMRRRPCRTARCTSTSIRCSTAICAS